MIETERLTLKPLTHEQLLKYIKADNSLEAELNINKTLMKISSELKDALEKVILPCVADSSKNYLFSTLWTLIHKNQNEMVGDVCFYGEANEEGEIEIGYGTYEDFRGKGFMTEAVKGMIAWAKDQAKIKSIRASTDKLNIASYSILEKNGFVKVGETEKLLNWKLGLSN
jgi:ribosomal-protein-alanine N-acetyltransferase